MKESDITDSSVSVESLIESRICPPWWVPSQPYLKRCIPFFKTMDNQESVKNETIIVDKSRTTDEKEITGGIILEGVKQVNQNRK